MATVTRYGRRSIGKQHDWGLSGCGQGSRAGMQQRHALGKGTRSLDVDVERALDVVVVASDAGVIQILIGRGDGSFAPRWTYR